MVVKVELNGQVQVVAVAVVAVAPAQSVEQVQQRLEMVVRVLLHPLQVHL
jgi:hypothetical protein